MEKKKNSTASPLLPWWLPLKSHTRPLACYITAIWPHSLNKLIQRWLPRQPNDDAPSPPPIGRQRGGFVCDSPPRLPVSWAGAAPLTQFPQPGGRRCMWRGCWRHGGGDSSTTLVFTMKLAKVEKRVESSFLLGGKTFLKTKTEEIMSCPTSGKTSKTSAQ